jgi:transcription initiation factor TFIIB
MYSLEEEDINEDSLYSAYEEDITATTEGVCPRCEGSDIVTDSDTGERICTNCGLVIEVMVDRGPEWRAFNMQEKRERSRTGLGTSYAIYDKGLSTTFKGNRDAKGRRLKAETKYKMNRLRRRDNRSKIDESWSRNLSIATSELNRLVNKLHLPKNVEEKAALYYRKCLKKDMIRGRSIDNFVAACIYAACRIASIARSLETVAKVSSRNYGDISRTYRLIIKELDLKMPLDGPMKYIPKVASKLQIDREAEIYSINLLKEATQERLLMGKDPRGAAAAALYIACQRGGHRITQKEIADKAGTTAVTLRNRVKDLEDII